MSKKVILGNSDGFLVDYDTKQKVIDWLYSKLDLSKYRYNIIKYSIFIYYEYNHYIIHNKNYIVIWNQ